MKKHNILPFGTPVAACNVKNFTKKQMKIKDIEPEIDQKLADEIIKDHDK